MPPAASGLLAASDTGVLMRSFVLAVVLVSPFALRQWWKVRTARLEAEARTEAAAPAPEPGPTLARLEDVIDRVTELGHETVTDAVVALEVPTPVTIDGVPAPAELVDALLADALRRSGFEQVGVAGDEGGRVMTCRRL